MKFATVNYNGARRLAMSHDADHAILLTDRQGTVRDMIDLVTHWDAVRSSLADMHDERVPLSAIEWLPPVPRPGKIVCIALNNSANKDRIIKGPNHPAAFIKPSSSLVGHGQPIRLRESFGRVHPEPELAVVIGRGGRDIAASDAYAHVFGYTIINDLTAPQMRGEDTFHYRAIHPKKDAPSEIEYIDSWVSYPGRYKGSDTFGPIGPWIATRELIPNPHALSVACRHGERLITEDSTENLTYKVPDVIAFLSSYMTLEPGDIISMGTALKKAGGGQAVQNVDLNALGGPIEVSISGIGTLSNPVETLK
jgi:2-keto-4-pentenoate hydratase/2-oxohepta-3-ene-1,7-dioic acid hydratase in catechol pathway